MGSWLVAFAIVAVVSASPAEARSVIAVGTVYGDSRPAGGFVPEALVLRSTGEDWSRVLLPQSASGLLNGVTFSAQEAAWAFGIDAQGVPLLLQSDDAGVTWTDVSERLPIAERAIAYLDDMLFTTPSDGWVLAGDAHGLRPYVAETHDGGQSWSAFTPDNLASGGAYSLAATQDEMVLLRGYGGRTTVQSLRSAVGVRRDVEGTAFRATAARGSADSLLLVGATHGQVRMSGEAPAIFLEPSDGLAVQQTIGPTLEGRLVAVDLVAGGMAVAAGWKAGEQGLEPLILQRAATDGTWNEGLLPSTLGMMIVRDVVCTSSSTAWAAVHAVGKARSAILHTTDSGRTWDRASHAEQERAHLFAIAAGPE